MTTSAEIIAPAASVYPLDWPEFGLGCAPLGDLFCNIAETDAAAMLRAAWDSGIRYFDTAPWYGHGLSEHRLGALLRQFARDEMLISTKVGRVYEPAARGSDSRVQWHGGLNFGVRYDYSAEGFAASVEQSRLRLGQPCIDALIIHDLDRAYHGSEYDRHIADLTDSGLAWLHKAKTDGTISAIGMGINDLDEFCHFAPWIDVDFFLVAMPYTLLDQQALDGPMADCVARGINIIIGAPFASGLLTDPANPDVLYNYSMADEKIRDKALAIESICSQHDVELMAAALQFPLLHPAVTTIIPGAVSADQVTQNVANSQRPIPPELWLELKQTGLLHADAPIG